MIALLLTIFIEFFPVFFLLRKEKLAKVMFAVIAINLATNPLANMLYPEIGFWLIEAGVILAELFLFSLIFEIRLQKGALVSLAANIPTIIVSFFY